MTITNPTDSQAVCDQLRELPQVEDIIVLDAGQAVLLILSKEGFSTYMPQRGITVVSRDAAELIAGTYWHTPLFLRKCQEFGL